MPLIVITFDAHAAVTPEGKPVAVPMPEAPPVVCVIFVKSVLIQSVGLEDAAPTMSVLNTVIVPAAETLPHPPVKGML